MGKSKTKKTSGEVVEAKIGRPTDYTQTLADSICEQLSEGISLRTVCLDESMPAARSVFRWLRTNDEFRQQYARAKQESADAMAEDILDIADDGTNDLMWIKRGGEDVQVPDNEVLQRSRLRVDTRKWLMSKHKPKKYADKLDLTTDGEKLPTPIMSVIASKNDVSRNNSNAESKGTDEED